MRMLTFCLSGVGVCSSTTTLENRPDWISFVRKSPTCVPSRMEAFFIENPIASRVSGLFSTHPSVDDRVAALERFAGAREAQAQSSPWAPPQP